MKKNYIILFSGGIDSSLLLLKYSLLNPNNNVECIYFNYGQKCFEGEFNRAKSICDNLNIKLHMIDISNIYENYPSALIKNNCINTIIRNDCINNADIEFDINSKVTEIPFRNSLFVLYGALMGMQIYGNNFDILIGIIKGGFFKDCTLQFVNDMNNLLHHQLNENIQLIAPLIDLNKSDVINQYSMLKHNDTNISKIIDPLKDTWSCYESTSKNECGVCYNCICKSLWRWNFDTDRQSN